jgi:CHAT domain-containing protein
MSFGRYASADRALTAAIRTLSAHSEGGRDLARAWNTRGTLASSQAQPRRARDAFTTTIQLIEAHGTQDVDDLPRAWRNLSIAQSALGQFREAAYSLRRALDLPASHAERQAAQYSLANAFCNASRYGQAASLYAELAASTDGPLLARVLGSFAILRERTGELAAAQELYGAAEAAASRPGADQDALAPVLVNAATYHVSMGNVAEARRLLRIVRRWTRGGGGASEIVQLSARADLNLAVGRPALARRLYARAVALASASLPAGNSVALNLRRTLADLTWPADPEGSYVALASALSECRPEPGDPEPAVAHVRMGMMAFDLMHLDAQDLARASLLDAVAMGVAELRWRILLLLARLQHRAGRLHAAILLGKLAVAALLRLGADAAVAGSGRHYREERTPAFLTVANWLAWAERVPEACEVHRAGLVDELYDLMRRDATKRDAQAILAPVAMTAAEERLAVSFEGAVGALGDDATTEKPVALAAWLDEVAGESWVRRSAPPAPALTPGDVVQGVTTVRYLPGEDGFRLVVHKDGGAHAFDLTATVAELGQLCFELRAGLLDQAVEVTFLAARLYDRLLAPAARLLADVRELRVVADGVLRYVPFAALHDGSGYLVERWAISYAAATPPIHVPRAPRGGWTAVGFGHGQLPYAARELHASVGRMPGGRVLLAGQFTREALLGSLRASMSVIHVVSHFAAGSAWRGRSTLTLGDGSSLRLDELRALGTVLSGVELIVLSACDTGLAVADEDGLNSLAGVLGLLGARTVLATHWAVDDAASADVVITFYEAAFAAGPAPSLAEALRRAQLEMLRGDTVAHGPVRGLGLAAPIPTSHPYFWAGYALFGDPT